MARLRTFHPFPRLPPEIQLMIFQYYRDIQPSVRHYIHKGVYENDDDDTVVVRWYAAIDIASHSFDLRAQAFADTSTGKRDPAQKKKKKKGVVLSSAARKNNINNGTNHQQTRRKARLIRGTRSPPLEDQAIGSISTDLALLSTADGVPDWPERDRREEQSFWVDVARDVVHLCDGACHWLAPFAYGRGGSLPFAKLPPWFGRVQKLALRLPFDDAAPLHYPYPYPYPWRSGMSRRDELGLRKWRLPDLRILYLVGFRDAACPLGAPCGWPGFRPDALDENNYLAAADFVAMHVAEDQRTRGGGAGAAACKCTLNSEAADQFSRCVSRVFAPKPGTDGISIKVVVDPY